MSNFLLKDCNILLLHSEWAGENLIRVRVRHFGKRNKVMVDVWEIAPKHTSAARALKAARAAARKVGCISVDCLHVSDQEIVRVSQKLDSDEVVRTKIRTMTFAFDGIAE